jgi:hypothetical protein
MNPWLMGTIIVLTLAILLACTLLVVAGSVLFFAGRKLAAYAQSIDVSLSKLVEPASDLVKHLKSLQDGFESVAKICSLTKELQEGEIKVIGDQVKAIKDLIRTVSEFEGIIFNRTRRARTPAIARTEEEELAAEKRRQQGGELEPLMPEFGKYVGTV